MPTPERLAKLAGYYELTEASPGGVATKSGAIRVWSALEHLRVNGSITDEQAAAGDQFHLDWYIGLQAGVRTTMQWQEYIAGMSGGGDGLDAAERKVFHVRRYFAACERLDMLGVRKPVHWCAINGLFARDVGRAMRGHRDDRRASASGAMAISIGLEALARLYGMAK